MYNSNNNSSGSGGRELKRGYAYNSAYSYMEESPDDVTSFPPPTPYKGTVYEGAGAANRRKVSLGEGGGSCNNHSRFQCDFEVLGTIGSGR